MHLCHRDHAVDPLITGRTRQTWLDQLDQSMLVPSAAVAAMCTAVRIAHAVMVAVGFMPSPVTMRAAVHDEQGPFWTASLTFTATRKLSRSDPVALF